MMEQIIKKDGKKYRILGFTEEAKKDKYSDIRLEAYRILG